MGLWGLWLIAVVVVVVSIITVPEIGLMQRAFPDVLPHLVHPQMLIMPILGII